MCTMTGSGSSDLTGLAFPEVVEIVRGREVVIGQVRYGGLAQPTREP
jgi:hypothetical protein